MGRTLQDVTSPVGIARVTHPYVDFHFLGDLDEFGQYDCTGRRRHWRFSSDGTDDKHVATRERAHRWRMLIAGLIGEGAMILWLLVKSVNDQKWQKQERRAWEPDRRVPARGTV